VIEQQLLKAFSAPKIPKTGVVWLQQTLSSSHGQACAINSAAIDQRKSTQLEHLRSAGSTPPLTQKLRKSTVVIAC
jgi:hypothetical protein